MEAKQFPGSPGAYDIDRSDPKKCLFSGLFEEHAEAGGRERIFYTYLTPGLHYNQPVLVVAPPDGTDPLMYLEQSPWKELADREQIFLHLLVPGEGGWKTDGSDADYMNRVYMEIQSRKYYVTMQDNIYAAGIGRGAVIAQQAAMKMTSEWSGLAAFGDLDGSAMLNAEVTAAPQNTGASELAVSGDKVQLPVWMAWGSCTDSNAAVRDYWKAQNDASDEPFSSRTADEIYFPRTVCRKSQINEEKTAQVRITSGFHGEPDAALAGAVWDFLRQSRRHRSFGTKALRTYLDPAEYGAVLHSMDIGGFTRIWYEYVPDSVKESGEPAPLVAVMHGRGGSAESFLDLSGMTRVAEERNFIAVFPEACVSQVRPGGLQNLLLWNGMYRGERIDDTEFILAAIADVRSRYPVDPSRIYACGQSSGGMMTASLAMKAPGLFAAVSPWSAVVNPDYPEPLPETVEPQVPFLFLFGDRDWLCVDRRDGELEYHVSKDIAAFLRNLMRIYRLEEEPRRFVCGEISWFVYRNERSVPMLVVGTVKDMTHANYPGESWTAYDEFFCRFSRAEDGTLLYMGRPAVEKEADS